MFQLNDLKKILRNNWWLILLTTLAAVTVSLVFSYQEKPVYSAKAAFLASPNVSIDNSRDIVYTVESLDKVMATYAEIFNSATVRQQALTDLAVDPALQSGYTSNAVVLPDATVLELTVTGPNSQVTADLANRIGQVSIDLTQTQYPIYDLTFLDIASVPVRPLSPTPLRSAGVAAALGLLVGLLLSLLREPLNLNGAVKNMNVKVA